ncbi:hypothetical protein [Bdellovibrio sp. HCB209]|uniref:hypothetical protein n=1 Tax=Bdellovibrio sp. HCB209 TaxID=3394354 RepID=UPI0039B3E94F
MLVNEARHVDVSKNRKFVFPFVLICIFMLFVLYSVSGVDGFAPGHMGFAGPDLLGTARNLDHTGYFLARLVAPDGVVAAYNHHPPMGFWFFNIVTDTGSDSSDVLAVAYFFAALISALGWLFLFYVFFKLKKDILSATMAIIAVGSAMLFVHYRAFTTFDVFSVLCSSILFLAACQIVSIKEKIATKSFWLLALGMIAAISFSWYSVSIIFVLIMYMGIQNFRNREVLKQAIGLAAVSGGYFILLWVWILGSVVLQAGDLSSVKHFFELNTSMVAIPQRTFTAEFTIQTLLSHFRATLPLKFLAVSVCLFVLGKIFSLVKRQKVLTSIVRVDERGTLIATCLFLFGWLLFILLTRAWSVVHPFAFLYLAAPLVYLTYLVVEAVYFNRALKVTIAMLVLVNAFANYRDRREQDHTVGKLTRGLLTLLDTEFQKGFVFKGDMFNYCGHVNPGIFFYMASSPNYAAKPGSDYGDDLVEFNCVDNPKGVIEFTSLKKKKIFTIRNESPNYETRDLESR